MGRLVLLACLLMGACAPATQLAEPTVPPTEMATATVAAPTETPPPPTDTPTATAVPTATFDVSTITANPETWPPGFAEAAGGNVTSQLSQALREPARFGLWQTNAKKLTDLAIEHPEWRDFIDYVLKIVHVF